MKIAIIGAGIAGLTCAHKAAAAGHDITVFDKGRGAGGRLSTRRVQGPNGDLRFDHGTMGFKTRSVEFSNAAREWLGKNWVALWSPRLGLLGKSGLKDIPDEKWVVGIPAMNSLVKGLCEGLDVRFGARLSALSRNDSGWTLSFAGDTPDFICDAVVMAVPAEQCAELLKDIAPDLANNAAEAASLACWSVMLGYDEPITVPYDLILGNGRPFSRLIRNNSKPGRDVAENWVLQAGPEWSAQHVDRTPSEIANLLETEFAQATGTNIVPVSKSAHRWLYALNANPASELCFWDDASMIGTCGDWHSGAEVQDAWISGDAMGVVLSAL